MKRSAMQRRNIQRVMARKLAVRFTHNVYAPGFGETHMKTADALLEFESETVKGMAYWPMGGKTVVVSFSLPDGNRDMYEVPVDEIVHAALRWRTKRLAGQLRAALCSASTAGGDVQIDARMPITHASSLPLLPEDDDEDAAHGNLGEPGAVQGPLPPPELPDGAE
jgi:hypothetical protein